MKCHFCNQPTCMTVRDNKDNIFPCCKECKDNQNIEEQKLIVHMITFPREEDNNVL